MGIDTGIESKPENAAKGRENVFQEMGEKRLLFLR